ncbi:MAG: DUF1961 family protein [Planctomycetota bacterium]|nr:DUF1961 family protein [Planctomycetota bacterium]
MAFQFASQMIGLAIYSVSPSLGFAQDLTAGTVQDRWRLAFADTCEQDWRKNWFLDGEKAKVINENGVMKLDTSDGYAVLWTREEFSGDLRIEYEFRRVDENNRGVNIIYIQATGDRQAGHTRDIRQWSDRRSSAAMRDYFLNMHTYHVSYAAYSNRAGNKDPDYIRARRYLPLEDKGLKGTELDNEYLKTELFEDKQWIQITLIKRAKNLRMEFKLPNKSLKCHFVNKDKPAIFEGRIGLRPMPGRLSEFRNVKVYTLKL